MIMIIEAMSIIIYICMKYSLRRIIVGTITFKRISSIYNASNAVLFESKYGIIIYSRYIHIFAISTNYFRDRITKIP